MLKKQLDSWKPRSYQMLGVQLMIKQACAGLLWKPGRGKTTVVYAAFRILQEKGFVDKMLVICPIRPMYRVWPHQCHDYADFDHLRVGILHGKDKEQVLQSDDYDIYVVNPEGLPWLFGATGNKPDPARLRFVTDKFKMLVVDESTKFKNSQTTRFKLIKEAVKRFKRRYILTGSFRPKNLEDLFGQVYILDEGASLGRYITHYRTQYFYPSGYGGHDWLPQPGASERVIEKIAPLCHVMNSEEGLGLPELIINDVWVDLPPDAARKYREMEDLLLTEVESGSVVAANAAVASGKCRQIANGIIMHGKDNEYTVVHTEKIEAVRDLMEQLQGNSALITYEFVADMQQLEDELKVPCISSGNAKKDDNLIAQFSRGEIPYVAGHPQSIALGIDGLQKNCSDIIMVGVPWSFELYEQVIQRVRRSGSKAQSVTVHRILARNTIDEKVIKVLAMRDGAQHNFLEMLRTMSEARRNSL